MHFFFLLMYNLSKRLFKQTLKSKNKEKRVLRYLVPKNIKRGTEKIHSHRNENKKVTIIEKSFSSY